MLMMLLPVGLHLMSITHRLHYPVVENVPQGPILSRKGIPLNPSSSLSPPLSSLRKAAPLLPYTLAVAAVVVKCMVYPVS